MDRRRGGEPLVSSHLIGTWRLVTYETIDDSGRRRRPYGDAVGRLTYDAHGNMTGQVMRPGRAPVEGADGSTQQVRAAYAGYVAYFGRYSVSADGVSVIHHVEGALNPAWVGGDQTRGLRFDGDRLVLHTNVPKAGGTVKHELTWEKI
jgi:Lipocalin-like domain